MKLVSIQDLIPGMHVGMDIYTLQNQLVVPKDTVLTQNIIDRLQDYSIRFVRISEDETDTSLSYGERLRSSRTFQEFKQEFISNVYVIQDEFNDVVTKNAPVNADKLLEKTAAIFSKADGTNVFDMLHNMREYDDSTYVHSLNVSLICSVLAKWMNFSKEDSDTLVLAGMLHDLGKLTIPDSIIKKPGKLTAKEFEVIKTHPVKGFEILESQT